MSVGNVTSKSVAHSNTSEGYASRRRTSSFFDEQDYKILKSQRVAKGSFVISHTDVPVKREKPSSTPSSFMGVDRNMAKRSIFNDSSLRPLQGIYEEGEEEDEKRSYQMDPTRKFCEARVRTILQEEITTAVEVDKLSNKDLSLELADRIKTRLKQCNFSRYKYVTLVDVGENKSQGVRIASRFFWDSARDTYVTETKLRDDVFIVATVYAVYFE